ncbi:ribosome biogenesis GTPase A [Peptoclostridium litorale DSM 5388]|uniref:Ribosome biogenesis GTPase A n=1 Tax=Peptoclostridium litorale DSM 5388 TaxID=1121324 RepID=A0A069RAV8_PEPLI|nr:ribosome biogenesis GTPase YlqF [Peptoclostridium litorale]KDR94156.1 ribosome biogenesis GTPase A [Peptoclostridium litorale DSM 5388]SIN81583.1 ribosome biogenesis GTPase A [Peptoclostridium litorale DSM 5388]
MDSMNINWYPGHMKKTRELIAQNLKLVDMVVEIMDSRIPMSSKNPEIDKIIGDKPKVIALNKVDLAEPAKTQEWKEYFEGTGARVVLINSVSGKGIDSLTKACREAVKDKMQSLVEKGRKERAVRMMIVGIPNVGKSSLINKLSGKKSATVGNRPGVTKGKQWVRLKGDLEMLDTPGILWPKFDNEKVALNLAFTGAIKDDVLDVETIALRLIERLTDIEPEKLAAKYKLDELGETPLDTMETIGKKRGCILPGREYDYTRIANIVLQEFRSGSMGKITLERPKDIEKETE